MKDARFYTRVIFVVLFAAVIPVFGMLLCTYMLPGWSCETIPLHAVIEFFGLFAGLSLAVLLLLLEEHRKYNPYYIVVASALIGMGILDAFHSAVPPAHCSIWLDYMRVLTGGFIFALVWISDRISGPRAWLLPAVTAFAAAGTGILSILYAKTLLALLGSDVFTSIASTASISGGLFFVVATVYFLFLFRARQDNEKIVFASFCLLMGTSAFMLPFSVIWDAGWWFWHLLYLIANILLLGYVFIVFRQAEQELNTLKDNLQQKVVDLAKTTDTLTTEISEREKVEAALRESEQRFRAIFDQTFQFIGLMTPDGTLVEANKSALIFGGIKESDVLGKPFWETPWWTHSPELQDTLRSAVRRAAEGEFVRFEATHLAADGTLHYIDFSLKPVTDDAGKVVLLIPEGRDITERKQAEEELKRKQHEMAAVLRGMRGVAVEYLDTSLTILWANEEMAKEFGVSLSEIRGKHCYEVMRNRKVPCPDCSAYKSTRTENVYDEEVALPDGRIFLVRCNPVIDEKGSVAGIVHAMVNITGLKLAEEELKLKNLILSTQQETSLDGILVLDKEGKVISSNQHFIDICGIPPDVVASQSGERVLQSVSDRMVDPLELLCRVEYLDLHKHEKCREEIALKDGRIIDRYSAPMLGAGDEYLGRVWYFRDITERRRADEALKQTTKKLSLLNSIAFNDIQNAVFSLSGYLELQKQEVTDNKQQQYLDKQIRIVRTITESLKFVNNYQNLGLKPPAWQSVHQSFLFGVSHLDISKLSRKLSTGNLEIYADPLLENVFFTLAENVVLHGETATEIALWYHETPEGLTLVFEDNGKGIPDNMKEKIFDRRYEEKRGMGLFLAREILSITGISIKETGGHKKGAKFEMFVPKGGYRFNGFQ